MVGKFKDMRNAVAAAPGLIDQSRQMAASAQQYATAQAGAAQAVGGMPAPIDPSDPILAPINGIDLQRYAQLSKAVGDKRLGSAEDIGAYMQSVGLTYDDWQAAYDGWNERFKMNMSLSMLYAQHFNAPQA